MSERIIITLERDYMGQTLRLAHAYKPHLETTKEGEEAHILGIIQRARAAMDDKIKELQTTKPTPLS